jgi:hypothetical protein
VVILPALQDATEEYNGTTWASSSRTGLNTTRGFLAGTGIQTAALAFGGDYWIQPYRSNRRI